MKKKFLRTWKIFFINSICINNIVYGLKLSEIIETEYGRVQGQILETITGNMKISAYVGIPYAEPPLGRLRFRPPVPKKPWEGVLPTINQTSACPQRALLQNIYTGNEDCLYLNVYTPKILLNDSSLRPVMVWIYGGAFKEGSVNASMYGPDFILEENVVFAAMNYRLGALGFLSLDHPDASGNAGLKDQTFALKWVKRNIKYFGGDPNLVTIFGQSAGSDSVELHKLSPLSKGLFERSIAMSGSPLNFWGICVQQTAVPRAFALAKKLNITSDNKTEIIEELYKIPADTFVHATEELKIGDLPFKPTIERPDIATDAFLTDCVVPLYEARNFSDEPHILGFTSDETLFFTRDVAAAVHTFERVLNTLVDLTGLRTILGIVFLDGIVDASISIILKIIYDYISLSIWISTDLAYIAGIDRTQEYLSKGKGPVYYYRNSFDYPQSLHRSIGIQFNGTGHADDIPQIFWVRDLNQTYDPNSDISHQRLKMVRMWTNMAKYGNPTPNGTSDPLLNISWPISGSEGTCLEIGNEYEVGARPIDLLIRVLRIYYIPFHIFIGSCNLLF